jgi:Spy/CpxP family protein refolding chaperone
VVNPTRVRRPASLPSDASFEQYVSHSDFQELSMNTNRIFKALGTFAAIGALSFSVVTYAAQGDQRGGGQGHFERGAMFEKLAAKLNLTADQKAKIQALQQQFQKDNATALNNMQQLRSQMKQYMQSGDKTNAQATRDKMRTAMEALKPAQEKLHKDMMAILTPDQQKQAQQLLQQHQDGMRGGRRGQKGAGQSGDNSNLH